MLDLICEKLGIEVGEKWTGNDGKTYMIDNKIVEWYEPNDVNGMDYEGWVFSSDDVYKKLLLGELKPVWKPEEGETYYIPDFSHKEDDRYDFFDWYDCEFDNWCYENNMVYKTKEEAIDCANRMLKTIK